jgi:hypothetical protein
MKRVATDNAFDSHPDTLDHPELDHCFTRVFRAAGGEPATGGKNHGNGVLVDSDQGIHHPHPYRPVHCLLEIVLHESVCRLESGERKHPEEFTLDIPVGCGRTSFSCDEYEMVSVVGNDVFVMSISLAQESLGTVPEHRVPDSTTGHETCASFQITASENNENQEGARVGFSVVIDTPEFRTMSEPLVPAEGAVGGHSATR